LVVVKRGRRAGMREEEEKRRRSTRERERERERQKGREAILGGGNLEKEGLR